MTPARALLAAAAAVTVLGVAAGPATAAYVPAGGWGKQGGGAGEFGSGVLGGGADRQYDDPAGIAIAGDGSVLVVDPSNNRVERFTTAGRFLGAFGRRGHDKGSFEVILTDRFFQPEGIAVDPTGAIYVSDSGNDRVMKFSAGGRFRKRLTKTGSFPGEVVQPWGIAIAGGAVAVADQGNYQIDRFATGGGFRGSFSSFGRSRGKLVTPYGVAATPRGDRIYVADLIRHVVIVFDGRGRVVSEFGGPGVGPGQFLKPAGVALGRDGSVFVADRCNHRVQHFSAAGKWVETFGEGALEAPTFLTVDRGGTVYVSDYHRVAKFTPGSAARGAPRGRSASHNGVDVWCRGVAEMNGVAPPRPEPPPEPPPPPPDEPPF
jgi:DNA-binding beta-propeller fold protein YncE